MARSEHFIRTRISGSTINHYLYEFVGIFPEDEIPKFERPIYKRLTLKGVVIYEQTAKWSESTGKTTRRGRPRKNA